MSVDGPEPRFLSFYGYGFDEYRWGIAGLVRIYSQNTCVECGLLRAGAAHRPGRRRCSCGRSQLRESDTTIPRSAN